MATCTIFDEDEVYRMDSKKGSIYGLVIETSQYLSSDDDEENNEVPTVRRGTVRVAWHPKGEEEVLPESKLKLADRSLMPGDVVRRLIQGENSQRGFVSMTNITCHALILGTNKVITNINTKELRNLEEWDPEPGDVTLDSWVGRIDLVNQELILKFADGARCQIDESELCDFEDVWEKRDDGSEFCNQEFYPGQHLVGRLGDLTKVKWLTTTKHHSAWTVETNRHRKVHVSVEKVIPKSIDVHWTCRGYATHTDTKVEPPPRRVKDDNLKRLKSLDMFCSCSYQIGDKCFYTIKSSDDIQTIIPSKGRSHASYITKETGAIIEDSKSSFNLDVLAKNMANSSKHNDKDFQDNKERSEGCGGTVEIGEVLNARDGFSQKDPVIEDAEVSGAATGTAEINEDGAPVIETDAEPSCTTVANAGHGPVLVNANAENPSAISEPSADSFTGDIASRVSSAYSNVATCPPEPQSTSPKNELKVKPPTVVTPSITSSVSDSVSQEISHSVGNTSSKAGSEDTGFAEDSTSCEEDEGSADDTDTGSLTSSQSDASGPGRKKTKSKTFTGLKFKHKLKGKKSKSLLHIQPQKEFKAGECVAVEIVYTYSYADVTWQDGSLEKNILSTELYPIHHLDELEFFPGDFVLPAKATDIGTGDRYGVVETVDHQERTCVVKWMRNGEDINPVEVEEPTEMSVYDIKDHPDFKFRLGHVVVRIGGSKEIEGSSIAAGQVCDVSPEGRVGICWADGSSSYCYPCHLYLVSDEMSDEWDSGSESEDSDEESWETEEEEEIDEEEAEKEKNIEAQTVEKRLQEVEKMMQKMDKNFNDLFTSMEKMDQMLNEESLAVGSYSKVFYEPILAFFKHCKMLDKNLGTKYFKDSGVQEVYRLVESEIGKERAIKKAKKALNLHNSQQKSTKTSKDKTQSDDDDAKHDGGNGDGLYSLTSASSIDEVTSDISKAENFQILDTENGTDTVNVPLKIEPTGELKAESLADVGASVLIKVNQNGATVDGAAGAASATLSTFVPPQIGEQRSRVKEIWEMARKCLKKQFVLTQEEIKANYKGNVEQLKGKLNELETTQHDETLPTPAEQPEGIESEDVKELLNDLISNISIDVTNSQESSICDMTLSDATGVQTDLRESDSEHTDVCSPVDEETVQEKQENIKEEEGEEPKTDDSEDNNSVFLMLEEAPSGHKFQNKEHQPADGRMFLSAVRKELKLLRGHLPPGIVVKGFEDRMDLYSVMFVGPANTPYEDGLFFFDIQLPNDYPTSPPVFHYIAYCSDRLNPNLYEDGKVCVSLLGTWGGKGSEVWTAKSNLLQVFVSIQGLILNAEPYYNEAGYERQRGSQQGMENSKVYNEMAVIKLLQSMIRMVCNPPVVFKEEFIEHLKLRMERMIQRLRSWVEYSEKVQQFEKPSSSSITDKPLATESAENLQSLKISASEPPCEGVKKPSLLVAANNSNLEDMKVSEGPHSSNVTGNTRNMEPKDLDFIGKPSFADAEEKSTPPDEARISKKETHPVKELALDKEAYTSMTLPLPDFPLLPASKGFCMSLKSLLCELEERINKYLSESTDVVEL